jgi:uncharacterized protein YkwD
MESSMHGILKAKEGNRARGSARVGFVCILSTLLGLVLLAPTETQARSPASPSDASKRTTGTTDREVASFIRRVNSHRVSRGLPALVWDRRAAAVAKAHSRDMFEEGYFSHTSPDGRSLKDRLEAQALHCSSAGENIAWGQETGRDVLEAWLRSKGHRRNIEGRDFTHHGVGRVGSYWTHILIRPVRSSRG